MSLVYMIYVQDVHIWHCAGIVLAFSACFVLCISLSLKTDGGNKKRKSTARAQGYNELWAPIDPHSHEDRE